MFPQLLAQGRPLPDWYLDKPELPYGGEFFLRAFGDLSTCRQVGQVLGPISWDTMVRYADRAGLSRETTEVLVRVIREMDEAYLDWNAEEARKHERRGGKEHVPGARKETKR